MLKPFISIIVPSFNRKFILAKVIHSLLSQTYPEEKFEIIIVDDSSPQNTFEYINMLFHTQIKNERIKYIKVNFQNPAKARNYGVSLSKGEIICFLDNDSVPPNDWLEKIVKAYNDYPEIFAVGGGSIHITKNKIFENISKIIDTLPNNRCYKTLIPTRNISYKKEVFKKIGFFDTFLKYPGEDFDFNLRLQNKGFKILYLPEITVEHHHNFTFLSFLKREFINGRSSYRLFKRWDKIYHQSFTIPDNIINILRILLGGFIQTFKLILKKFSVKTIIFFPFILLQQLVFRLGIIYEYYITKK